MQNCGGHNHLVIKKFDLLGFFRAYRTLTQQEQQFVKILHDCNLRTDKMMQILALLHDKGGKLSKLPYIRTDVSNLTAKYHIES